MNGKGSIFYKNMPKKITFLRQLIAAIGYGNKSVKFLQFFFYAFTAFKRLNVFF